jgi:hypothetical protein
MSRQYILEKQRNEINADRIIIKGELCYGSNHYRKIKRNFFNKTFWLVYFAVYADASGRAGNRAESYSFQESAARGGRTPVGQGSPDNGGTGKSQKPGVCWRTTVSFTAIQTLLKGGAVFPVSQEKVPDQAFVAKTPGLESRIGERHQGPA